MKITPESMPTDGAFGSRTYPVEGVRAGLYATSVSRGRPGGSSPGRRQRLKVDQLWARAKEDKPRMVAQAPSGDLVQSRFLQAFDHLLGVPVVTLKKDNLSMSMRPDFNIFDAVQKVD